MRSRWCAFLILSFAALLIGCSAIFGPGSGGFKITSASVEPNPVKAGGIAALSVTGQDARKGGHDCLWPGTQIEVSAGGLYYSREEAEGGDSPYGWQEGGKRNIDCLGTTWWIAPDEPQTATINVNFGGATRTIMIEVVP